MLDPGLGRILLQLINFLILAVALYFLLFRPMMRRMKEQAAEREQVEREMAQDRQEAERLRAALEDRLASVEQEATAIVTRAREQAEAERAALLQEAEAEAERILAEAHTSANQLWNQTADEFHQDLLDTVLEVSGQVIGKAAPPEVHDTLVQQLSDRIWEMGRSEMRQVETLRRALGDREPTAYVTTAHSLSPQQQGLLARTFSALADRNVNLDVKVDAALAGGVRVRLGDMVVDNTIADRLAALRENITQTLEERMTGE